MSEKTDGVRELRLQVPAKLYERWERLAAFRERPLHDLILVTLECDIDQLEPTTAQLELDKRERAAAREGRPAPTMTPGEFGAYFLANAHERIERVAPLAGAKRTRGSRCGKA